MAPNVLDAQSPKNPLPVDFTSGFPAKSGVVRSFSRKDIPITDKLAKELQLFPERFDGSLRPEAH